MNLSTYSQTAFFQYSFEGLTVIEPGDSLTLNLTITPLQPFNLQAIHWQIPDVLASETVFLNINEDLDISSPFLQKIIFSTQADQEGFGEMKFKIVYSTGGDLPMEQEEVIWISVFKRKIASEQALDDELRHRLVSVVNSRPLNGHIFLADYVSFFSDFLNIEIPASIVHILANDFNLSDEGLPQNHETYLEIVLSRIAYYAIKRVELIYEEECNESDDRFDIQEAREVELPSMD